MKFVPKHAAFKPSLHLLDVIGRDRLFGQPGCTARIHHVGPEVVLLSGPFCGGNRWTWLHLRTSIYLAPAI